MLTCASTTAIVHVSCREHFAPDLLTRLIPTWSFVPSPRNITVERGWRPLFEKWGVNILSFYYGGLHSDFYEPDNELHK